MLTRSSHIVLDACCVFNLIASGYFFKIITAIPAQITIARTVWEEELIHFDRFEESDRLQLDESINNEILQKVDFESESETDLFVNYVAVLKDDGESVSVAIAISRGWAIATDDKAATNLFRREKPDLEILSTPEILKYWAEKNKVSDQELKNVLNSVRVKGRYLPPRGHLLANWWASITQN
jgi:predicted nucleic acid-binding protein